MNYNTELTRLVDRVLTDRRFCGDENHKALADGVRALIGDNERLSANVKLNLCDHPAIHWGDVDLLIAFVSGTSQIELAKMHGCTPPNISRKIRRVKARLGWREGMSVAEIRARAEQLRSLASQGAVVTADLMAERDQLKVENQALRNDAERYRWLRSRESAEDPEISVTRWTQLTPQSAMGEAPRLEVLDAAIDAAMGKGSQS